MTTLTMASKINQGNYQASKSVSDLQNNGYFKQDGKTYVLLQCAYADNNSQQEAAFFAEAVKIGDEIIDGVQEITIQSKIGFSISCKEFSEPHFFILKFEISFFDEE